MPPSVNYQVWLKIHIFKVSSKNNKTKADGILKFEVSSGRTIEGLKRLIQTRYNNTPPERQQLVFRDIFLNDNSGTLGMYGIGINPQQHISIQLRIGLLPGEELDELDNDNGDELDNDNGDEDDEEGEFEYEDEDDEAYELYQLDEYFGNTDEENDESLSKSDHEWEPVSSRPE